MLFHSIDIVSNIIGYCGVIIILIAFYCSQTNKINHDQYTYSASNFIGSIFLLFSLYYHPNPPSIVIEVSWLGISLIGMIQTYRKRRKKI